MMQGLVLSGRIVDLILIFVVLEAGLLFAFRKARGRGLTPLDIVLMLLPGVCLLLALRAGLMGVQPLAVLGWLAAALVAHLADVWQRWSRA